MNRNTSPIERLGNALAFLLVFGILAFGAYFMYTIITGENDLFSLGGTSEVRPTEVVIVAQPTLTPFVGGSVAPPSTPTPLFQQPTAAPPTATNTPLPTNTPAPTSEPSVSPTLPLPPTPETSPIPTEPPPPTQPPTPTEPPIPTAVPPTATPPFSFRIAAAGPDYSRGCSGFYVFGYVRDPSGNPLPGLRVRVVSEWGLEIPPATTKSDPPGWYDVLISQQRSRWFVTLVDAANAPLSPTAELLNTGAFVEGSEACWHQVDFVRVN